MFYTNLIDCFDLFIWQIFVSLQRGPNRVPVYALALVAAVTITFILIGDINSLAPVVTLPFLAMYAIIDYAYFALAMTFDLQCQREHRFRSVCTTQFYLI